MRQQWEIIRARVYQDLQRGAEEAARWRQEMGPPRVRHPGEQVRTFSRTVKAGGAEIGVIAVVWRKQRHVVDRVYLTDSA